jgi:hypothetical protein
MRMALRVIGSFFTSLVLVLIGGHIRHPRDCVDCFAPHGFPFTYGHDGGLRGGAEFYRGWMIADIVFVLMITAIIAWAWGRRSEKNSD